MLMSNACNTNSKKFGTVHRESGTIKYSVGNRWTIFRIVLRKAPFLSFVE